MLIIIEMQEENLKKRSEQNKTHVVNHTTLTNHLLVRLSSGYHSA